MQDIPGKRSALDVRLEARRAKTRAAWFPRTQQRHMVSLVHAMNLEDVFG